ncbi:MAG TPA: hypothetical protein VK524_11365 [Polyangiaceae bacterium]|nr:hypothetical protein [Polyangiaceae bacterium]
MLTLAAGQAFVVPGAANVRTTAPVMRSSAVIVEPAALNTQISGVGPF